MLYRRSPGWGHALVVALLATAAAAGIAAYSGRRAVPPEEVERRNAAPHRCDDEACRLCEVQREWLRRNPGRYLGDAMDALGAADD